MTADAMNDTYWLSKACGLKLIRFGGTEDNTAFPNCAKDDDVEDLGINMPT